MYKAKQDFTITGKPKFEKSKIYQITEDLSKILIARNLIEKVKTSKTEIVIPKKEEKTLDIEVTTSKTGTKIPKIEK